MFRRMTVEQLIPAFNQMFPDLEAEQCHKAFGKWIFDQINAEIEETGLPLNKNVARVINNKMEYNNGWIDAMAAIKKVADNNIWGKA